MKLDFQYFVIRFLEKPMNSIPDYVYIPSKWIKNIIYEENKVEVPYPTADNVITEELVNNDINFDDDWKVWPAKLVCGCDSYSDAQKDLETINIKLYQQLKNNRFDEDTKIMNTDVDEENNTSESTSRVKQKEVAEHTSDSEETTTSERQHHSKSFRKRSLSLNSTRHRIKKSRTESTKETIENEIGFGNADDATKEKIAPLHLCKTVTNHKTEYVIINNINDEHNCSINPVEDSQEQCSESSTESEVENEYLTNLCNDLLYMKKCAVMLFNNFELLSNTLLENKKSCRQISSVLKDLRSLYESD